MKSLKYIFIILFLSATFVSCTDDLKSSGVSKTTYYPTFTQTGSNVVLYPLDSTTSFVDPGEVAMAGTVQLPLTITVTGLYFPYPISDTVSVHEADCYKMTYSAINKDGFAGYDYRTVWVAGTGDMVSDIEGLYSSTNLWRNASATHHFQNLNYVIISKTGANTYAISDAIGGYYDLGKGYGPGYAATGATITAVDIPSNNFTFGGNCAVGGFGGAVTINGLNVNPVNKTIVLTSSWSYGAGYTFVDTMTQVKF